MELNSAKSMVDVARAADRFVCAADCVAPEGELSQQFRTKGALRHGSGARTCVVAGIPYETFDRASFFAGREVLAVASYKATL
jgi:hypothetical protein